MASPKDGSSGKAAYKALDDMISKNSTKILTEIKQELEKSRNSETAQIMTVLAQVVATQNEQSAKLDSLLSVLERTNSMRQLGLSSSSSNSTDGAFGGAPNLATSSTEVSSPPAPSANMNIIAFFKKIAIAKNFEGLRDKFFTPENIELLNQVDSSFRNKNPANEEAYQIAFGYAIWNKCKPQTEAQKAAGESPEPFISKEEKDMIVKSRIRWKSLEAMSAPREEHLNEE